MLFGIIIVAVAIFVAYLINKSKVSEVIHEVEDKIEPVIKETKEVIAKAEEEVKKAAPKKRAPKTTKKQ